MAQFDILVDQNARYRRRAVDLQPETCYGQLLQILQVELPAHEIFASNEPTTILMVVIRQCKTEIDAATQIPFYTAMGAVIVADLKTVQCLVGRVHDRDRWNIIDRGGALAKAQFLADGGDDDDPHDDIVEE